ncbi:MAG: NUDIX hydrolase, partial [Hyphomicrobiales bacterium]
APKRFKQDDMVPTDSTLAQYPVLAVCIAIWQDDKVLLVKRAHQPNKGLWALPGGKVDAGETIAEAALRELSEETNLQATPENIFFISEIIEDRFHYVLHCIRAENPIGTLQAGDDAAEANWMSLPDVRAVETVPGLVDILEHSRSRVGLPL